MPNTFDEISLTYWDSHKKQVGSSKSYSCYHEGYVYGDEMTFVGIEYIYRKDGLEEKHPGTRSGPKWAYFDFVQSACNKSESTLQNFLTNPAEKFRVYSEAQVAHFSAQKRNSTRIKDQSCKIVVSGEPYYVANNLKVCEYFNSAAMNVIQEEKDHWFIRIYFEGDPAQRMADREESEEVVAPNHTYKITVAEPSAPRGESQRHHSQGTSEAIVNIDFETLNQIRRRIGDLGEAIVLDYERDRLRSLGLQELAMQIEHTSKVRGDNCGYDIASFTKDGTPLFIEVKTTKQNKAADFYLSRNECLIGNQFLAEGKLYRIYRIYNLNPSTGTGDMVIYKPPFDDDHYVMQPENWRIQLRES